MTPSELKDSMRRASDMTGTPWTVNDRDEIRLVGRADCLFCPVTAVCYVETGAVRGVGEWREAHRELLEYADDGGLYFEFPETAATVIAADTARAVDGATRGCIDYRKAMLEVVNEGRTTDDTE